MIWYLILHVSSSTCVSEANFYYLKAIPQHRHIYISTLAHRWAVISGPPSLFPELWSYSKTLASASKMTVPIGTPAHAPHIQPIDISKVLGQSPVYELPIRENVHVISTSTCQPFEGLTLGDVLTEALGDITCRMLNLAGVIDYIISELQDTEAVDLDPLGPKSQIESFKKALENGGVKFTTQSVQSDAKKGLRDGSDLVAVVGMASGKLSKPVVRSSQRSQPVDSTWKPTMIPLEQRKTQSPHHTEAFWTILSFLITDYSTFHLVKLNRWIQFSAFS
jgi:hypothetical protein